MQPTEKRRVATYTFISTGSVQLEFNASFKFTGLQQAVIQSCAYERGIYLKYAYLHEFAVEN